MNVTFVICARARRGLPEIFGHFLDDRLFFVLFTPRARVCACERVPPPRGPASARGKSMGMDLFTFAREG